MREWGNKGGEERRENWESNSNNGVFAVCQSFQGKTKGGWGTPGGAIIRSGGTRRRPRNTPGMTKKEKREWNG